MPTVAADLTVDGKLTVNTGGINVTSGSIQIEQGSLHARNGISTNGDIFAGKIYSKSTQFVDTYTNTLSTYEITTENLSVAGNIANKGSFTNDGNIKNTGSIQNTGDITVTSGNIWIQQGSLHARNGISTNEDIYAGKIYSNSSQFGDTYTNTLSTYEITTENLSVAGNIANKGSFTNDGDIKNTGNIQNTGDIIVTSGSIRIHQGSLDLFKSNMSIDGDLYAGTIYGKSTQFNEMTANNISTTQIDTQGLQTNGITNTGTTSTKKLEVIGNTETNGITNTGMILNTGDILQQGNLEVRNGDIVSTGNLYVEQGLIAGNQGDFRSLFVGGTISSNDLTNSGTISTTTLTVSGASTTQGISNNGSLSSTGNTTLKSADNKSQVAVTNGNITVGVSNAGGSINGVTATTTQTVVQGGTGTTTLTLDDTGATFNGTNNTHVVVTGVANGQNTYDATNYGQLRSLRTEVMTQINDMNTELSGGIAAVTAMSSIPQLDTNKQFTVGVGAGHYNGSNAFALGARYRVSEGTVVSGSFAKSNDSKPTIGVGAGLSW
ncbi:YadA C-terminal domain-containing protein [Agitococcus lubricus]|uniref:YadA-like protein n=1 Tax=Agitococcus lubricus TaxID=1077255 RepID=A0A2T5J2W1_9GAMM|nr:YadA C-terminal domain-containing protein [Agitococcus lubricus]PTQ90937.1 YadA-like protein [Agitococcus lubricus]